MRLTKKNVELLGLIGKFRFLSQTLIAKYFGVSEEAIRLMGYKLNTGGFLRIEKVFHDGQRYFLLDKLAVSYLDVKYFKKINYVTLVHDDLVYQIAINEMINKKEIALEHELKEQHLLKFENAKDIFLPDLLINNEIAVEVELNIKELKKRLVKINKYNQDTTIKKIMWISNKPLVLKKLCEISNNIKHEFYLFEDNILNYKQFDFSTIKTQTKEFTI